MNISTEDEVKNLNRIRQRINDGFYCSSTVIQIIAEKLIIELKLKN